VANLLECVLEADRGMSDLIGWHAVDWRRHVEVVELKSPGGVVSPACVDLLGTLLPENLLLLLTSLREIPHVVCDRLILCAQ
jgi:hypothetical protein